MDALIFSRDVHPVSDLKTHANALVDQVVQTRRPMLVTRRGRGVAVLVEVGEFERLQEELAFGRAVDAGAAQAAAGEFASETDVDAVFARFIRS